MSATSRKRSRKSKLVARTYDSDDNLNENDETGPSEKNPVLNVMPSPMQFSVKVEVEECDDLHNNKEGFTFEENWTNVTENSTHGPEPFISDIDISKEAHMLLIEAESIDLHTNTPESSIDLPIASNLQSRSDTSLANMVVDKEKMSNKTYYRLSIEDILNYQPDPTDIAVKMICIEIRNILGRMKRGSCEVDHHDALIQTAIGEKKHKFNQFKDILSMFKCYICHQAWWHLFPFREHIRQHGKDVMVTLELQGEENNMIAYRGTVPLIADIDIDSNCWHCGKTYSIHKMTMRNNNGSFNCLYCSQKIFTCTQLIIHEGLCFWEMHDMVKDSSNCHECPYCPITFFTNGELDHHLVLRHSVRSDVPMPTMFKYCPYCKGKYYNFHFHVCPARTLTETCVHCDRRFPNKILWDVHLLLSEKDVKCPLCDDVLAIECLMTKHLLNKHSSDFTSCAKCTLCPDFFVFIDEESRNNHRRVIHKRSDKRIFETVVIPNKLLVNPLDAPLKANLKKSNFYKIIEALGNTTKKTKHGSTDDLCNSNTADANTKTINDVKIKTEPIEMDSEPEDYESIIQANQIGHDITLKTESDTILPEESNIQISNIKTEAEDTDSIDTHTANYKQLLSNALRISDNYMIMKNEVKIEPEVSQQKDELVQEDNEPEEIRRRGVRRQNKYKCRRCGYTNYHKEYKLHIANNCKSMKEIEEKDWAYPCTKCLKSYETMKRYLQHLNQHGYDYLKCPVCLQQFDSVASLKLHVNYHIRTSYLKLLVINRSNKQTKVFQCKKCKGKVVLPNFFAHWELHLELKNTADGDEVGGSDESVSTALDAEILKELIKLLIFFERGHQRMKIVKNCPVCHRHFDRSNDCKRHLIEHLLLDAYASKPENKMLKCQICCEGFRKADEYKQHMRDHGSLPVYKCELCNKTFSDSSNFTKHKKIHNLRVLICDICGKKFQAKLSIEKHMLMHRVTKPMECNVCHKLFHTLSAYKKHEANYHTKTISKFKCLMCSKRFNCLKDKWDHMWQVHKERKENADCPICDKSFRKYNDVKAHVRNEHEMGIKVFNMTLFNTEAKRVMAEALQKSLGVKKKKDTMAKDETLIVFE